MHGGKGESTALEGIPLLHQVSPSACGTMQRALTIPHLPGETALPHQHNAVDGLKADTNTVNCSKHAFSGL